MLKANTNFQEVWGKVRYADMLITLQWLYEKHPQNNAQLLLDSMHLLIRLSYDVPGYWTKSSFMFQDLDTIEPPILDNTLPAFGFARKSATSRTVLGYEPYSGDHHHCFVRKC